MQIRQYVMCPSGYSYNGQTCMLDSSTDICPDVEKDGGEPDVCPVGNPLNPARGIKYQSFTDYRQADSLLLLRYYSQRPPKWGSWNEMPRGMFGKNWLSNYDVRILRTSPTMAFAYRPGGKVVRYLWNGSAWASDADVVEKLYERRGEQGETLSWNLLSAQNVSEEYDENGRLVKWEGSQGRFLRFTYLRQGVADPVGAPVCTLPITPASGNTEVGRIYCVSDEFGRQINFSYDLSGKVKTATLPGERVVTYSYDGESNLVSILYPDGKSQALRYNEPQFSGGNPMMVNALTGIVDENGNRFATWTYDSDGRAISSEHSMGVDKYKLAYSAIGTTITDPLGTQRTQSFQTILGRVKITGQSQPGGSGCGASSSNVAYDGNGNVTSRTDFNGNITTYTYDLTRNLETKRVEASGKPEARTVSSQWHSYWRLPTAIAEPLKKTTWVYNGDTYQGSVVNCAPPSATVPSIQGGTRPIGVLCKKVEQATTDSNGTQGFSATASGSPRIWNWTHNQYGQVLTEDGPRTDVADITTYTYYDAADPDLGKRGNIATITNALNQVTRITAYDPHGNPLTIIDPNGLVTNLTYDLRQRLTSKQVGDETTSYQYDGVGQLTRVTLPDGRSLIYTYDSAHRLTSLADSLGNQIRYTLDAMGNRTKEDVLDPNGQLSQTRSRVYDALNRLYQDIGAANQTTQYAYDANGNLTGITDPLNRTTSQGFDPLNRLIRVTDPGSGQIQYAYNGQDRLIQVTDPRNLSTTYTLDGLGNLTRQASPDTGTTQSTYDESGNVLTRTDAKGQTTTTQYDAINRPIQVTYADGNQVRYTWDVGGNGIGRLGRVEEVTAGTIDAVTEYAYTSQGRLATATTQLAGKPYTTAYTYVGGELASLTYPSGKRLDYTRNGAGQITQVQLTDNGKVTVLANDIRYRPFGGFQSFTNGAGRIVSRAYDTDGRVTGFSLANQTWQLGYDSAGRINYQTDTANAANTASYSYDALDRLTGTLLPSTNLGYGYDATGNRTSQTVGGSTYASQIDPASNRLQSTNTAPPKNYSYDAVGSRTADSAGGYSYDARGRLVQTTTAAGTTQYRINALGQRVRKTGASEDTLYHYDHQGHLIAESTPTGRVTQEYIWLGDTPIAVIQ